ncbi:MAG: hypothetical protein GQ538_02910 [Xanthomonadales bacterium]|nr:hypothetical protein [Xanthomonadales bacterium]
MNMIHNNGENDQALDDGLEKLSRAYGKLKQDEPAELLDQAILNSAHRAIEKKSGWKQFGWMHGLATAAVFVLAFTIILDQGELAPEFNEDVLRNAPSRAEGARALKKQSVDKVGKSHLEMEARDELRQKSVMETMPELTAPAAAAVESPREEQKLQTPQTDASSQRVQGAAAEKIEYADKDDIGSNEPDEEIMMDEADVLTESAPADLPAIRALPTAVAEPASSAIKARGRMDSGIEQEIQAIIELKNAGDEAWVKALEVFIERYPDYPLPDELKR